MDIFQQTQAHFLHFDCKIKEARETVNANMDVAMEEPSTQQNSTMVISDKLKDPMADLTSETNRSSLLATCSAGEPTLEQCEDSSSSADECVEPMDVDAKDESAPEVGVGDTKDVFDQKQLLELLTQSKAAGKRIAGEDIMLLIGGTGAGKVCY